MTSDSLIISGVGCVSPLGMNVETHMQTLWQGYHGFRPITQFDTKGSHIRFAGEIEALDKLPLPNRKLQKMVNRKDLLGISAAYMALQNSGLLALETPPERRGAFVGSCSTQIGDFIPYFNAAADCISDDDRTFDSNKFGSVCLQNVNPLAAVKVLLNSGLAHICQLFTIKGANTNLMDLQCSGLKALEFAQSAVKSGMIDWAVVGAISAPLDPFQISTAYKTGVMKDQRDLGEQDLAALVRPFDTDATGTLLSEAAIFFTLESELHFLNRGGNKAVARLVHCASSNAHEIPSIWQSNAPLLINNTSNGCPKADRIEADLLKQKFAELGPDMVITNQNGLLGDTAEARGLFGLLHAAAFLADGHALGIKNLATPADYTKGLPLLVADKRHEATQALTYTRNDFGQVSAALIKRF